MVRNEPIDHGRARDKPPELLDSPPARARRGERRMTTPYLICAAAVGVADCGRCANAV